MKFSAITHQNDRFLQGLLGAATLLGVLFSPGLGANQPAQAVGFVRHDSDVNNPFYKIMNDFQQFSHTESKKLDLKAIGAQSLDPSKLSLQYDYDINIFFLNEGANYRNQLGAIGNGTTEFEQIVFNDITCVKNCSHTSYRSPWEPLGTPDGKPLEIGDYYNLGVVKAGTSLDFFLRRDGYNRATTDIWYTQTALNSDGIQHVMAYEFKNYLVLAWEDLNGGGDQDYNDVIFAVDLGDGNIDALVETSEPQASRISWIPLLFGAGLWIKRKFL